MKWNKEMIKELREKLGLTQYQFASLLETSQRIISDWETGKQNPRGMSHKLLTLVAEKENLEKDIEKIISEKPKKSRISPEEIKAFRERLCLDKTRFAERLERDISTVSKWESGERDPGEESIRRMKVLAKEEGIELPFLAKAGKIPESERKTDKRKRERKVLASS